MIPSSLWIVLAVCAVMCSIGFYKFYYFLSAGYGFAICGAAVAILVMFGKSLTPITVLICILLLAYGLRLGGFLIYREFKSASYRNKIIKTTVYKPAPFILKVAMWICVSLMYVAQVSPVFYRCYNGDNGNVFAVVGFIVMLIGFIIESIADKQKSDSKRQNPNRFCDIGLYKYVRCPNYFGEITFWSGVMICGVSELQGAQWVLAFIGYILIFYVMLSGAKRLEHRQNDNYGNDSEYQEYVEKTPILFPFIPIYHLQKCKFIIE